MFQSQFILNCFKAFQTVTVERIKLCSYDIKKTSAALNT